MHELLKVNNFRYFLSVSIAFFISMIAAYYLAKTNYFLMPFTTLYVMQTSIGNAFYQGVKRFLLIILIVVIASVVTASTNLFYVLVHDILLGAMIGVGANIILFPRRADVEFRRKILPIIKNYNDYFSAVIDQLLQQNDHQVSNTSLEKSLLQFPSWVYEAGFNPMLQKGYRFFLIQLEKINNILFSLHHLSRHSYDKELIAKIRPTLLSYVENTNQFFIAIATVLELKKLTEEPSTLENEITELQKQFFAIVPANLELLDMRRDYVYLAAFIFNLKDLQKLLLMLGEALR